MIGLQIKRSFIDTERDAIAKDLIESYGFEYWENEESHMSLKDKNQTGHYKGESIGLFLPLDADNKLNLWAFLETYRSVDIYLYCPTIKVAKQLADLLPEADQEKRYIRFKKDEKDAEPPQLKYLTRSTGKAIQERLDYLIPRIKKAIKALD